jgi:rhodanese-related sulfurtransferase
MLKTLPELIAEIRHSIKTISAKDAYEFAQKEKCVFIDVREPQEVDKSPVKHSINMPRGILEMNIGNANVDENSQIFLHCASGGRASLSAEQLTRLGYKNVWAIVCPHNDVCSAQNKAKLF